MTSSIDSNFNPAYDLLRVLEKTVSVVAVGSLVEFGAVMAEVRAGAMSPRQTAFRSQNEPFFLQHSAFNRPDY